MKMFPRVSRAYMGWSGSKHFIRIRVIKAGKLFALYHNENYPSTGVGYLDINWPQGLRNPETKTAVCRIGIMKSTEGSRSWSDNGILLEDHQPILP